MTVRPDSAAVCQSAGHHPRPRGIRCERISRIDPMVDKLLAPGLRPRRGRATDYEQHGMGRRPVGGSLSDQAVSRFRSALFTNFEEDEGVSGHSSWPISHINCCRHPLPNQTEIGVGHAPQPQFAFHKISDRLVDVAQLAEAAIPASARPETHIYNPLSLILSIIACISSTTAIIDSLDASGPLYTS